MTIRPINKNTTNSQTPPPSGGVLTPQEIDLLLQNLDSLTDAEVVELQDAVKEADKRAQLQAAHDNLLDFAKLMMSEYKVGNHHKRLAELLEAVERRDKDRITVSIAPRHGKSQMVSIFYAAWYLGRNPTHQIILASHTADLAVDFGRKVRNLIGSDEYKSVFPHVELAADSKSAGRWNTNHGGMFYAAGVGGALAGRGADLLLLDDPASEQDILAGNFEVFEKAYQWYTYGARTRLMPGGAVCIVATRWHMDDIIGRVQRDMIANPDADQFEVFEFPAIIEKENEDGKIIEKALWPEFFDLDALHRTKASMPTFQWAAQYQQKPTAEEAAIIKREWWRVWKEADPPKCEFLIMSLDAAAEKHNRADYTSLTTWGVWYHEKEEAYQIILLNAVKERFEFPELKAKCLEEYNHYEPDAFIVEKKSAGVAIYQELRRMGLPISEFTPHRGTGDKTARLNSVSDIVSSGLVWVPETRWADELVEEIAAFPYGSHDDQVDSTVQTLMRFRQGGFLTLPSDETLPEPYFRGAKSGLSRYY